MVAKEHFSMSTANGFGGWFWAFCYITMQQSAASRRLLHFSAAVVLITLLTKSCSDYFCDKSCSDYSFSLLITLVQLPLGSPLPHKV